MNEKTSKKISLLTWIATILMVVYHSWALYACIDNSKYTFIGNKVDFIVQHMFPVAGSLAMVWFFTCSGYLLYRNADRANIGRKLKSRVKSLYVPLVVWTFIVILVRGFWPFNTVESAVLAFTIEPIVGAFWYISAIFILALFSPLILKLKDHDFPTIVFMVVVVSVSAAICKNKIGFISSWEHGEILILTCMYTPFYFAGAVYGMYESIRDDLTEKRIKRICLGVLLYALLLLFESFYHYLVVCAVVIYIFWKLLDYCRIDFKLLDIKNVFLIFATHKELINILDRMLEKMHIVCDGFVAVLILIAYVLIIYLFNVALYYVLKPLFKGKVLSILTGGRA